jgi:hypothetical protein
MANPFAQLLTYDNLLTSFASGRDDQRHQERNREYEQRIPETTQNCHERSDKKHRRSRKEPSYIKAKARRRSPDRNRKQLRNIT